MITRDELNPKKHTLTDEQKKNQDLLFTAINTIRKAYGKPMTVTSGVRSLDEHKAIYKKINDRRIANRQKPIKVPMGSMHLKGAAVDISDPHGDLWIWLMQNIKLVEEAGLYLEDKNETPTWVHAQIIAPASGNRIFKPF